MVRAFTRAVAIFEYERPKEIRSLPAALASDRAASARPLRVFQSGSSSRLYARPKLPVKRSSPLEVARDSLPI